MALTKADLASLLADKPGKKQAVAALGGGSNAWVKVYNEDRQGTLDETSYRLERESVSNAMLGKFHNKAGTMTRSAKGRSRMNPDGYVRYINPAMGGDVEVVAYLAEKTVK